MVPLCAALAAIAAAGCSCAPAPSRAPLPARVKRVVDGDTFVALVAGREERVRVLGIDTPELHDSDKLRRDARRSRRDAAAIQALGRAAAAHAKLLLEGVVVTLELTDTTRDKYGRVLAFVRLPDGRDFGEVMLADGYARLFHAVDHPRKETYRLVERNARLGRRGLWADGAIP